MHCSAITCTQVSPSYTQFGVFPDTSLHYLSKVLESRAILLQLVEAKGYVVQQLWLQLQEQTTPFEPDLALTSTS